MKSACLFLFCLMASASAWAGSIQPDFHVAPDGDDRNPGTAVKPFATLGRARDAVRALKAREAARDFLIVLHGGRYRVSETIVFSLADSAPDGHTITYAAHRGETPVLSAAMPVKGWAKVTEAPAELPEVSRGKVWSAPMPDGLRPFHVLYDHDEALPRARGKGFLPTEPGKSWHGGDQQVLRFPAGTIQNWSHPSQIELRIITSAPWTMNLLPLESVDEAAGMARTAIPGTYLLTRPVFGHFPESAWIENALAVLDEPGEWVMDGVNRRIYLWPKDGEPGDGTAAPILTEMIRIEGNTDHDGPEDKPVKGLVFSGITFTQADRFTWEKDRTGLGVQHDWEMFDRPTAMFRMRGAENCVVEKCQFLRSGAAALRLDLHARNNRIEGNMIGHVGGVGILLAGYGPGTKNVNRDNRVSRNHIHHVGEEYWHSPAVFVWQSGENEIANNLIHDTPYSGIVVSGRIVFDRSGKGECSRTVRWHETDRVLPSLPADWAAREPLLHSRRNRIIGNEIRDVVQVMTDGNAIYISGAGRENLVRGNHIHDCSSRNFAEGIRCDDDQFDTTIDGNILQRLGGLATYICIKGRNHVTNNIFAEPLNPPARGMLSLEPPKNDPIAGSMIQRNIFLSTRKDDRICFQGMNYYGRHALLSDCESDSNLYHNTADPEWGRAHIADSQSRGAELKSLVTDPMFVDWKNDDFSLRPGSPALKLGFKPVNPAAAGVGD